MEIFRSRVGVELDGFPVGGMDRSGDVEQISAGDGVFRVPHLFYFQRDPGRAHDPHGINVNVHIADFTGRQQEVHGVDGGDITEIFIANCAGPALGKGLDFAGPFKQEGIVRIVFEGGFGGHIQIGGFDGRAAGIGSQAKCDLSRQPADRQ